jgi:spore germination protein YaaH
MLTAALCTAALAFAPSACGRSAARTPGPPPRVFAFVSQTRGAELEHLRRFGSRISVIAPNWYDLTLPAGTLAGSPHQDVVALARAHGTELWPVVNALLRPGDLTGAAFQRGQIAATIASEAAKRGYDGVTLDIEQLTGAESGAFTALVALLSARLHAQHDHLAVYVPRRTARGGDRDYDWPALARSADLLIASGYNEHSALSAPGAVMTRSGFAQLLDYAAAISRFRVAPALGAFGYSWPAGGGPGELISSTDAEQLRREDHAPTRTADGDVTFRAGGRVVHYQNSSTLDGRAHDARASGMRWLALFSLGREPNAFWAHLTTARQRGRRA